MDNMEEYIQGGNIFFEVIPLNKCQKKIIIYLSKNNGKFEQECKCYASHYLEQIFDENNQIVSEVIKENPHCNL